MSLDNRGSTVVVRLKSRQPLDEKFEVVLTGLNHALTVCTSGYRIIKLRMMYFSSK